MAAQVIRAVFRSRPTEIGAVYLWTFSETTTCTCNKSAPFQVVRCKVDESFPYFSLIQSSDTVSTQCYRLTTDRLNEVGKHTVFQGPYDKIL